MALFFTSLFDSSIFLNTLTPKFYVALTGTSSLISGAILIFEWWYYSKYGHSFIEHVSLTHISPWLNGDTGGNDTGGGGGSGNADPPNGASSGSGSTSQQNGLEHKFWRNPISLFRGAEYQRFYWATNKDALTFNDMNLSAQEHQTCFTCDGDAGKFWRSQKVFLFFEWFFFLSTLSFLEFLKQGKNTLWIDRFD